MRQVIGGKIYDTATATEICDHDSHGNRGDFSHYESVLYVTSKSRFFLAGGGGPQTRWAESCGQNSWSGGKGIIVVDRDEARAIAERAGASVDMMVKVFAVEPA